MNPQIVPIHTPKTPNNIPESELASPSPTIDMPFFDLNSQTSTTPNNETYNRKVIFTITNNLDVLNFLFLFLLHR